MKTINNFLRWGTRITIMGLVGLALAFGTSCKTRDVKDGYLYYDAVTGASPQSSSNINKKNSWKYSSGRIKEDSTSIADKFEGGIAGPSCPYPRTNCCNRYTDVNYNDSGSDIIILRR